MRPIVAALSLAAALATALSGAAPRASLAAEPVTSAAPSFLAGSFGDRFIYWPTKHPIGDWRPEKAGLRVEDRALTSRDGTRLHAWWSRREGARATVLFLHGNGGNLSNTIGALAHMQRELGVSVYAVDYRGYGKSAGRPSEEGLYMDAEAAYDDVVRLGADPGRLFLHGHSLGTGVATELAGRRQVAGVTLEAPFTSITAMVKRAVPFADPKKLVSERYDTVSKVPALAAPLLVVHGTDDATIPVEMGRAVHAAARGPKALVEIEGAGHNDCHAKDPAAFFGAIRRHMEPALGGSAASPAAAPPAGRRVEF